MATTKRRTVLTMAQAKDIADKVTQDANRTYEKKLDEFWDSLVEPDILNSAKMGFYWTRIIVPAGVPGERFVQYARDKGFVAGFEKGGTNPFVSWCKGGCTQ